MRPNPHSTNPSTTLPTTHCSYFPAQNSARRSSASQERQPSTTSHVYHKFSNMNINLYNKAINADFKFPEAPNTVAAPISSQRYNYPPQDHRVPEKKASASPTPYETRADPTQIRRSSAQVQTIQNQLQASQSSYNIPSKVETRQSEYFFTFKKDAQNQFFNLSDVSSVHYASTEHQDSVVTKLFLTESKEKSGTRLEDNREATDSTLNLPGSDFKSNKQTEPLNQPKAPLDTPTKLISCLEKLNTPSTPPKKKKKSQAATDHLSSPSQQKYIESPELPHLPSPGKVIQPVAVPSDQVKPSSLTSEISPFGFESIEKEYENSSVNKNSIGNPSYCTQSPSIKYNSYQVKSNFGAEKNYDKEVEFNAATAFRSQTPELKKSSDHNYYSYLSMITVQSSEDQGNSRCRKPGSSQPSLKQLNTSQDLLVRYKSRGKSSPVDESRGRMKQGDKTPQGLLRSILKPSVTSLDYESNENKKKVSYSSELVENEDINNQEIAAENINSVRNVRESKSLEKYCSMGSKIMSLTSIDGESKESTEQWLLNAQERASQILNRLSNKATLSSPLLAAAGQQNINGTSKSAIKAEGSPVEIFNKERVNVKKDLLKAGAVRTNIEIKISDLLAQSNKDVAEPKAPPEKEKEKQPAATIKPIPVPQPASLTFGDDLSAERSSKTSDSLRPAFFKEKVLESAVMDKENKEKEKKQGIQNIRMPSRTNSNDSLKDCKDPSNRKGSVNGKGSGNLDTSDMQYSESQGSNNMVCIGSRVPSKEGESRQVTEESPFAGGKGETCPMIGYQREDENKEKEKESVKDGQESEQNCAYVCKSVREHEFSTPSEQVAANTSDLEELQRSIMSKIEGIHSDIIDKINVISNKIDLEMSHCAPMNLDGTATPFINQSFAEIPSPYLLSAKNTEIKMPLQQHYNNNSIVIEGSNQRQAENNVSSEIYEYDSQSRTYSIRPPLPLQTTNTNKQPSEGKLYLASQRSGANMENPFSNRSSNLPIPREKHHSNYNSISTSNNVSICIEQLLLEHTEKKTNGSARESLHHRPPKPSENKPVQQQQNTSTSPYKAQKKEIKSKGVNGVPKDLPKPLGAKSQNKPSNTKTELSAQYSSQAEISDKYKKPSILSHSGSAQKGSTDKGGLNLSAKSFSEKKESLESELNHSWGTNVRFSAKRNSAGTKEQAPPIEISPQEQVTKESLGLYASERMMALFNSSPIVEDKEDREHLEQRKAYLIMSPDFSFPGSRDSSRHLESGGSTHHGRVDSSGQVYSVNHEMQRLEKKLEKYLKAGNSFELEPIREMSNSDAYYNQGLASRNSSMTKIDPNATQIKKNDSTQSVKSMNKWHVKEKEMMSTRRDSYGQTVRGDKKNTSSNSFRKSDKEETSAERSRGGSREGNQGKSYVAQMLNKKMKGMIPENSGRAAPKKSFYY